MLTPLRRRFLLDTNIVIALFAGEARVLNQLQQAVGICIPSIVLGELYYGARKSAQIAVNTQRVDDFAVKNEILSCDLETARQYGIIKKELHSKGRPLPENDIWIAALAIQHDMILVTRDAHFNEIEGLSVEKW